MERILASDAKKLIGKEVLLQGSLHKTRDLGGLCFGVLRDRSGIIQIKTEDRDSLLPKIMIQKLNYSKSRYYV